jgi:hypothetical protein
MAGVGTAPASLFHAINNPLRLIFSVRMALRTRVAGAAT